MRNVPEFLLKNRTWILLGVGVLTLLFGFMALRVDLDRNPEEMLFQGDPDYPLLRKFLETFGYDEIVVAAYAADDVLKQEHLQTLKTITDELLALQGVDRVLSLVNAVDVVTAGDGSLELQPLLQGNPATPADREALRRKIEENPHYQGLLLSPDSGSTLMDITLKSGLDMEQRKLLLQDIERIFSEHGAGKRFLLSGAPFGRQEMFRCLQRDMTFLFPLSLLLLVAAMYGFFRNLLWAVLPLAITSICVLWAVGGMSMLNYPFNLLSVIVPTVLLIIGTSDCIHILSRYGDCLQRGGSPDTSALDTLYAMALPCLLTTITTMAGFLSLLLSPLGSIRQFGVANAVGIGFAYILSMLLLPLGLRMFKAGDAPRPGSESPERLDTLLNRIFRLVMGKRVPLLLVSSCMILLGAYGTTRLRVETDLPKFFAGDSRGVVDAEKIEETFGGFLPVHVILNSHRPDGLKDPGLLREIDRLCTFLREQDGVDKVLSITDLLKLANRRLHENDAAFHRIPETRSEIAQLLLMLELTDAGDLLARFCDAPYTVASVGVRSRHHDFYSIQALQDTVSGYLEPRLGRFPEVTHHVTGTSVLCANTLLPLLGGLKESLFLALCVIFLLMVILFRSVPLGIVSMIPNILPIVLTLGTMGLGNLSLNIVNAPVAAVALGLAVDDTIHFLTGFRKEFARDRNYAGAIEKTLVRTGRPILITSLVLAAGFGTLLFSDFHPTRSFGVLISLTVLYAVFADLVLLPVLLLVFKPLGRQEVPTKEPHPQHCMSAKTSIFRYPKELDSGSSPE